MYLAGNLTQGGILSSYFLDPYKSSYRITLQVPRIIFLSVGAAPNNASNSVQSGVSGFEAAGSFSGSIVNV